MLTNREGMRQIQVLQAVFYHKNLALYQKKNFNVEKENSIFAVEFGKLALQNFLSLSF